jgi:predicted esterase
MGMPMPGWYDIVRRASSWLHGDWWPQTSLSALDRSEDETGIREAQQYFHNLIKSESEKTGIPPERIVLGGFSQGGAIALFSGLSYPQKLGGVVGLSCYMLLRNKFRDIVEAGGGANKETKIFMGHGDVDGVVKHQFGKLTADTLIEWGYQVDFRTYPWVSIWAIPPCG